MKDFIVSYGTRPELHKLWPVIHRLRCDGAKVFVLCTGQHSTLLRSSEAAIGLSPDINLWAMAPDQTLPELAGRLMSKVAEWAFGQDFSASPECWIVQGDTTSALMMALAARYLKIPVAHVEAGLRTWDDDNPFPEEINRRLIAQLALLHFAPTKRAEDALLSEGVGRSFISVVGNTEVDATFMAIDRVPALTFPAVDERRYVVVTAHRRESQGAALKEIATALGLLAEENPDTDFYFILHPNPKAVESMREALSAAPPNVMKVQSLDFVSMTHLLAKAHLVMTDSGGLQESCASLGVPVVILRDLTERMEAVEAGAAIIGGRTWDSISLAFGALFFDTEARTAAIHAVNPFGDGDAAQRIVEVLRRS